MAELEFNLKGNDNFQFIVRKFLPTGNIRGVVVIVHGMAEHSGRYERFALKLNKKGFAVYAHDQRGHGKTAGSLENVGFFAKHDGWSKVTADLNTLIVYVKGIHKNLPVFLLGHSMGSFIARTFVADYNTNISGLILSGTAGSAGFLSKIGILLAWILIIFKGKKSPSPLMNKLSFGDFNKKFEPCRTNFDWLSRDNDEVDKYIQDEFCGGIFSVGFFKDLIHGVEYVNKTSTFQKINKSLPILLVSGDKDPVSKSGVQVFDVFDKFQKLGFSGTEYKLYPEARHELLNETNRDKVMEDICFWIEDKL